MIIIGFLIVCVTNYQKQKLNYNQIYKNYPRLDKTWITLAFSDRGKFVVSTEFTISPTVLKQSFSHIFFDSSIMEKLFIFNQKHWGLLSICLQYFCFNIVSDIVLDGEVLPKYIFAYIPDFFYLKDQDT